MKETEGFASRVLERIGQADPRLIEAALQQLLSQKQLLEVIFENLHEGLVVTDPQMRVLMCNARARRWLGVSPQARIVGQRLLAVVTFPEIFEYLTRTDFSQRRTLEQDFQFARPSNRCLQLTSYAVEGKEGSLSSIVFVLRDVTEARQSEFQRRQAESIASMATLTAGIAHEFKNPINSLTIHAELANRMIDAVREGSRTVDLDRLEASLHAVLEETRRMARIVDDFLVAVRPTDPEKDEVALGGILETVVDSFRRECEQRHISVDLSRDPDMPPILLDREQITRALAAIVRNAIEAIETRRARERDQAAAGENTPDTVDRDSTIAQARPEDSIRIRARIEGDDAVVEIADTGCGIAADDLGKVFEPYFTTKFSGSGLGLMNVYRIAREHDGKVEIESEEGHGTRVRLRLPLSQRPIRLLAQEPGPPLDRAAGEPQHRAPAPSTDESNHRDSPHEA